MNIFIEQTIKGLKKDRIEYLQKRFGGFSRYDYGENRSKQGVLVMGLNPAGDDVSSDLESKLNFYFNYVPNFHLREATNITYFKPIYDFVNEITNNDAKWAWCNLSECEIENIISKYRDFSHLYTFYKNEKNKTFSIFTGEMFYVHMTKQNEFLDYVDFDDTYIKTMLNLHIDLLEQSGVNIRIIYINNAYLSRCIERSLNVENKTKIDYYHNNKIYKIVLGAMLSGQRAMDVYSRRRLVSEIKDLVFLH